MIKNLTATRLACSYFGKIIFEHISFELMKGEILLVQGDNGSGKSSLLRILAGLSTPAFGNIFWQAESIHMHSWKYHEHLHYMSHQNGIKLGLSVVENIQLSKHLSLSPYALAVDEVLQILQLSIQRHTLAAYLSAGQKRRLALSKLFLFPKTLWILDEPLTALDMDFQAIFLDALETHLQHGGMAILSSHHLLHFKKAKAKILRLASC